MLFKNNLRDTLARIWSVSPLPNEDMVTAVEEDVAAAAEGSAIGPAANRALPDLPLPLWEWGCFATILPQFWR